MTNPSAAAREAARKEPRCARCGSYDVVYEGPAEGYWCRTCEASDADE